MEEISLTEETNLNKIVENILYLNSEIIDLESQDIPELNLLSDKNNKTSEYFDYVLNSENMLTISLQRKTILEILSIKKVQKKSKITKIRENMNFLIEEYIKNSKNNKLSHFSRGGIEFEKIIKAHQDKD